MYVLQNIIEYWHNTNVMNSHIHITTSLIPYLYRKYVYIMIEIIQNDLYIISLKNQNNTKKMKS